jgi:exonuclease VII large subunit
MEAATHQGADAFSYHLIKEEDARINCTHYKGHFKKQTRLHKGDDFCIQHGSSSLSSIDI